MLKICFNFISLIDQGAANNKLTTIILFGPSLIFTGLSVKAYKIIESVFSVKYNPSDNISLARVKNKSRRKCGIRPPGSKPGPLNESGRLCFSGFVQNWAQP